jgi:hypothetical protein
VAEEKQLEPLTAKERKKFSQGMPLDPATKNAVCWQFVSHGRCPFTEAYRYAHTVPASRSPTEVELGLMDFGGSHLAGAARISTSGAAAARRTLRAEISGHAAPTGPWRVAGRGNSTDFVLTPQPDGDALPPTVLNVEVVGMRAADAHHVLKQP